MPVSVEVRQLTTLMRAPRCSSSYSQHPVFGHNLQHGADRVARYAATKQQVPRAQADAVAQAAYLANANIRGLRIPDAQKSSTEIEPHAALEAYGELALEQHALSQYDERDRRAVVALVAAMHLALYGPLPVGNWGGFTTPEIAGCPKCIRNNIIRWVRMPTTIARAATDGILDPAWADNETMLDEQRVRWVRLTWRLSSLVAAPRLMTTLSSLGFTVTTHDDFKIVVASRVLTGVVGKAMRWAERQFHDVGAVWYGAESFYSVPPTY
jgi:hypothetical protein